jgi:hypothetical protein
MADDKRIEPRAILRDSIKHRRLILRHTGHREDISGLGLSSEVDSRDQAIQTTI